MKRTRAVARRRGLTVRAVLLTAMLAGGAQAAHGVVTITATSANVNNPGDFGRICVVLHSGGEEVAGTQNDLRWDGRCATLPDKSSCSVTGSHGKSLQHTKDPQGSDFSYRALLLSLSDTDPMPDGPLYCCNFQGEAEPGQCCRINVTNVGASDPTGNALEAAPGPPARLCTAQGSSNQGGRGTGSMMGNRPPSASNEPPPGAAPAAQPAAPPAAAPSGAGGRPVGQVLPGGGVAPGSVPEQVAAAPTPPVAPPAAAAAPAAVAAAPATAAAGPANAPVPTPPAAAAPTTAATEAATPAPTLADTPTARATVAATAKATRPAPPKGDQAKPAAAADSGWFGCQIGTGAGASVAPLIGLIALLATRRRRRQARRGSGPLTP